MPYIDRDELRKWVEGEIKSPSCSVGERAFGRRILIKIATTPTADVPEKNVGKWVEEVGMLMCSECGDAWGTEQFDEVMSFNYCPNCGADMRKETEDE